MKVFKVNIENLITIKNFAVKQGVTPAYIYKLVKEKKMAVVTIDGVQFVDLSQFSQLPTRN